MCGITGLWTPEPHKNPAHTIRMMNNAVHHRGPDGDGFWQASQTDLHFGHRRLSIIDLSANGAQPMTSPSGRYTITYNGEIYNFPSLKATLEAAGTPPFKGHSDTEIFLHALDLWGFQTAVAHIEGMFAFAVWDHHEKMLHLCRDHFGKKPLYIGWAGRDLVFASELKAIMQHPDFQKKINTTAQHNYMTYGYIPAPHTIFEHIWHLPAGHYITLNEADLTQTTHLPSRFKSYWSAADIAQKNYAQHKNAPLHDMHKTLHDLLKKSVAKRMMADVPLGSFLSGGIDSTLITALMQAESDQTIKTYAIGFEDPALNEAPFAAKIAAHLGTDHHEHSISGRDALETVPKLAAIYDEPFSDISALPTYLLNKFAGESVTVALSGDGGDEMMGGYTRHIHGESLYSKTRYIPKMLRNFLAKSCPYMPPALANKLARALPFMDSQSYPQLFERLLSLSPAAQNWILSPPQITSPYFAASDMSPTENMILSDTIFTLPHKFLTKLDRASMANSLEARSPFLDINLFEYAWSLPQHVKISQGQGKWLLRQILKEYVPEALFNRPKQGFNIPVAAWLRGDLRDWAEDLLQDQGLEHSGLDGALIRAAWGKHQRGHNLFADKLWAVCQYQAWARQWGI